MSGGLQLLDPVSAAPHPAKGISGRLIISKPANAAVITPDNVKMYDPPIEIWVGDNTAVTVNIVPYGKDGDASVSYPISAGMGGTILPVLCKQVLATGTTAASLRGHW